MFAEPAARPTPYPEVNAVLALLLEGVRAALGEELVGLYLSGSLSSGDFDPGSSDIDFLVVTVGALPEATLAVLRDMHARIAAGRQPWATRLEGVYWPRAALRRHDPADARHPTIGVDWAFGPGEHGPNWVIERRIVRERGVTVWGPPPRTLIDPVSPDALRAATLDTVLDRWPPRLRDPEWLRTREYQAFAILTMCRALYTLEQGEVASKSVAAAWARDRLEQPWPDLIDRALPWRGDERPADPTETLAFIRYTIARCRRRAEERGR